jgi:hypothetical protein
MNEAAGGRDRLQSLGTTITGPPSEGRRGAAPCRASRFPVPGLLPAVALGVWLAGCDGTPRAIQPEPIPDPDPIEEPLVVSYLEGAPSHLNWGEKLTVTAFFPEQRDWAWVIGAAARGNFNKLHSGGAGVRAGTPCANCHAGSGPSSPRGLGAAMMFSDPAPIAGKEGHKNIEVQAAYDAENFYMKVSWQSDRPGITHETYRFNGTNWVPNSRNKASQLGPNEHYSYEDRLGVLISDRNLRADPALPASVGFETAGCWITCHANMRHMSDMANPAASQAFIGEDDVRKYLLISRDGAGPKTAAELAEMRANGDFLDLWQFRAARGAPVYTPSDDYVLHYRLHDIGGVHAFFDQMPGDMRWMYDGNMLGFNAIPMDEYEQRIAATPLISEGPYKNAVPYDPAAKFEEGDILPRRVLRTASGNRGDVTVYSHWENDTWTVIFKRALVTANSSGPNATDKALDLAGGKTYTLGFGVFDDFTTSRRHYVTFPLTLGSEATGAAIRARAN